MLVCQHQGCQHALGRTRAVRHLRDSHHMAPQLLRLARSWTNALPSGWGKPPDATLLDHCDVIPQLRQHQGLACNRCNYCTTRIKHMKAHCRQKHRCRSPSSAELPAYSDAILQTWYSSGPDMAYWRTNAVILSADDAPAVQVATQATPSVVAGNALLSLVNSFVANANQKQREAAQAEVATSKDITPWLKHVRWLEIFEPTPVAERPKLRLLANAPVDSRDDQTEAYLLELKASLTRLSTATIQELVPRTEPDALRWLAGAHAGTASWKPWAGTQEMATMQRYLQVYSSYLYYLCRIVPQEDIEDGDAVDLTPLQLQELQSRTGLCKPDATIVQLARGMRRLARIRSQLSDPTPAQAELLEAKLDKTVAALCIRSVEQRLDGMKPAESLMMHWLAIMGIDPSHGTLRPPQNYTQTLAAVLWVHRMIVLRHCWHAAQDGGTLDFGKAKARMPTLEMIKEQATELLTDACGRATARILQQLAYGKRISREQGGQVSTIWHDNGNTLVFKGRPIKVLEVRQMVMAAIDHCEEQLRWLMLGDETPFDTSKIQDTLAAIPGTEMWGATMVDPSGLQMQDKMGSSGAADAGSAKLVHRSVVARQAQWQLLAMNAEGTELAWNNGHCMTYLAREEAFLRELLCVVHVTGGAPSRARALLAVHVATNQETPRGLYLLAGAVAMVTAYDKMQSVQDRQQFIVRYLPPKVGQLVLRYVAWVRPFARSMAANKRADTLMFAGQNGPWDTPQASGALASMTARLLGTRLPWGHWRHVAIAIARQKMPHSFKTWRDNDELDVGVSDDEEGEELVDAQAGHGSLTARAMYARNANAFLRGLHHSALQGFRQASLDWHSVVLGAEGGSGAGKAFEAATAGSPRRRQGQKRKGRSSPTPSATESPCKRSGRAIEEEPAPIEDAGPALEALVKGLYGQGADYRSEEQRQAMEVVMSASRDLPTVVVLGTSAGKSVMFMGLALLYPGQVTVVVLPYAALLRDMFKRAQGLGVSVGEWQSGGVECSNSLMLVSAEAAGSEAFLGYAQGLVMQRRLRAIFLDECHVTFVDSSYRPALRSLYNLRALHVPMILLTATLPPVLEGHLQAALCIDDWHMRRYTTDRRLTEHILHTPDPRIGAERTTAELAIEEGGAFVQGRDRGIVYVTTVQQGREIAELIGCPLYHGKMPLAEQQEVLAKWRGAEGAWLVATSALGTGLDVGGIVCIIHAGRPNGLLSYLQQSGRGGRAGEIVRSIMVCPREATPAFPTTLLEPSNIRHSDEAALTDYLTTEMCRRAQLTLYADGLAKTCEEANATRCDTCNRQRAARHAKWRPLAEVHEARVSVDAGSQRHSGPPSSMGPPLSSQAPSVSSGAWPASASQFGGNDDDGNLGYDDGGGLPPLAPDEPWSAAQNGPPLQEQAAPTAANTCWPTPPPSLLSASHNAPRQRAREAQPANHGMASLHKATAAEASLDDKTLAVLELFRRQCIYCHMVALGRTKGPIEADHLLWQCPEAASKDLPNSMAALRSATRIPGGKRVCFTCLQPQFAPWCTKFREELCKDADTVKATLVLMLLHVKGGPKRLAAAGVPLHRASPSDSQAAQLRLLGEYIGPLSTQDAGDGVIVGWRLFQKTVVRKVYERLSVHLA